MMIMIMAMMTITMTIMLRVIVKMAVDDSEIKYSYISARSSMKTTLSVLGEVGS